MAYGTKPSIAVPSAETYVKHALQTLGLSRRNTGYWSHSVQVLWSPTSVHQQGSKTLVILFKRIQLLLFWRLLGEGRKQNWKDFRVSAIGIEPATSNLLRYLFSCCCVFFFIRYQATIITSFHPRVDSTSYSIIFLNSCSCLLKKARRELDHKSKEIDVLVL